jgi:hypothetical protein
MLNRSSDRVLRRDCVDVIAKRLLLAPTILLARSVEVFSDIAQCK